MNRRSFLKKALIGLIVAPFIPLVKKGLDPDTIKEAFIPILSVRDNRIIETGGVSKKKPVNLLDSMNHVDYIPSNYSAKDVKEYE